MGYIGQGDTADMSKIITSGRAYPPVIRPERKAAWDAFRQMTPREQQEMYEAAPKLKVYFAEDAEYFKVCKPFETIWDRIEVRGTELECVHRGCPWMRIDLETFPFVDLVLT